MDPETEHLVQDAIDLLLTGRTSVVIAHRFSTIRRSDRVLVLQHGQLREDGPHDVLRQQGGLYAMLHELSFGVTADAPSGRAPIPVTG